MNNSKYHGLRKLSSDELIERAKSQNWPDVNRVTYVMNNDTISIDSVQKLNYHEIAFDDYIDSNGDVVLAKIRPITEDDKIVRKKMNHVSKENNLDGQLRTIDIFSESLGQKRHITTYIPSNIETRKIIYLTDGSIVDDIAREIHPLIMCDEIQPVRLIGIHSDYEYRSQEYIRNEKTIRRFENHLKFFTEEVPNAIEEDNSLTSRYLIGFSNGADYCNFLGANKPKWANKILALSGVAYFPSTIINDTNVKYPIFHIYSGTHEELEYKNLQLKQRLSELGAEVFYEEFIGGHDYKMWKEIILQFIIEEFRK